MEQYQKYKKAYPNKTNAEIIENLANELKDKVETIHRLLDEIRSLKDLSQNNENKWKIEYNNDVADYEDFYEWWEITNGEKIFKADSIEDAEFLLKFLNKTNI